MLSRQSSFILEKSVISSSSSFLSFSYLQYVHQSSSNESGLIRWAVHSDLISDILFKISVKSRNLASQAPLTCPLVIQKRELSVPFCLFSLSPTCSTCINRAQMNLVWSDGQWTLIWFLVFCSKYMSIKIIPDLISNWDQFVFFFSLFLLLAVRASIEIKWIWSDQMGSAQ